MTEPVRLADQIHAVHVAGKWWIRRRQLLVLIAVQCDPCASPNSAYVS